MGRPRKQDADWFKHDKDMRNDPKVKALRRKFGLPGYSIWNMTLEALTDSEGISIIDSPRNREILSGDFEIDPEKLREVWEYCIEIDLFQRSGPDAEGNISLSSRRLVQRLEPLFNARSYDRVYSRELSDRKRQNKPVIGNNRTDNAKVNELSGIIGNIRGVIGSEERRGEETRGEESKKDSPLSASPSQDEPVQKSVHDIFDYILELSPKIQPTQGERDAVYSLEIVHGREVVISTYKIWKKNKAMAPFAWFIRYFDEWRGKLPKKEELVIAADPGPHRCQWCGCIDGHTESCPENKRTPNDDLIIQDEIFKEISSSELAKGKE